MDGLTIARIALALSGAFTLICLGSLFLKAGKTLEEVTMLTNNLETTITKVNTTVDDVNYKLDQLNPPVELVNKAFTKKRSNESAGALGVLLGLKALFSRKK